MSIFRQRKSPESRRSRSRLIIGLLLLILLLVLALAWQASRTLRSHRDTATNVLQDYARLITNEYSRRAMGEVGYYGYYTYINWLRRQALKDSNYPFQTQPQSDSPEARASRLASYVFLVDVPNAEFQTSEQTDFNPGIESYLSRRASEILEQPLPDSGFIINHVNIGGRPHTFVISKADNSGDVLGFEVNRSELSSWLREAFEQDVLLPASLASGAITNEYIYIRFVDNDGLALFESRHDYDPMLLVSMSLGDEYEGIFTDHTISAAIDPVIAGSLVIGGLPRSRLPVLLALMLLTVGLLIAAIRQLQREHALMKIRADFISEVSHELRTPLTQVRMFTETLLYERFSTTENKRRALEIINRESQRLIHLVENVLAFSNKQSDRHELHIVNHALAPAIKRVVDEFQPLAESTGAIVRMELDPQAFAAVDINALRQVLLNLLDNAIKYGPTDQIVKVTLKEQPTGVQLSVSDQGPGIPRNERERIWDSYYRLDREHRSAIAGTGIGLAVVRELLSRHDGKAWVEDGCDGGACFVVEFPKAPHHEGIATSWDATPGKLNPDEVP